MIGVLCHREDVGALGEFFELFKTPWELYQDGHDYDVVLAAGDDVPDVKTGLLVVYGARATPGDDRLGVTGGVRPRGATLRYRGARVPIYGPLRVFTEREPGTACVATHDGAAAGLRARVRNVPVIRLGYDLAREVRSLLTAGQPVEHVPVPTLDLHVAILRDAILAAGLPLLEIPAAPAGYRFAACLTHDIDFAGIRYHRLDHTVGGFLYRATLGALGRVVRGRLSLARCLESWRAAAALPWVYLGWARDFWEPFTWYLRAESGLPATYFLIPFKRRPGQRVGARHAARRAAAYDVGDVAAATATLARHGSEVAVHGIDAWHDADRGREERGRIAALTGASRIGIRMHWLLGDEHTPRVLEDAGYAWDSSLGSNETVGYRNGTSQPFRPPGATSLLELPLHIQDGALFLPGRLDLTDAEAWTRCRALLEHVEMHAGVLTLLWHDRSHAPERFWGDFYVELLDALRARKPWFATAGGVVDWFARRRGVRFERTAAGVRLSCPGPAIDPPLAVRVHGPRGGETGGPGRPAAWVDIPWAGTDGDDVQRRLAGAASPDPAAVPAASASR